ncbi:MAG TPA: formylglycine-generating enzyme family protein [Steroidobacteraceae bacterium]|nr:formylglycine-generating enzyme family protein [Steroidobacteraceae bacterium]
MRRISLLLGMLSLTCTIAASDEAGEWVSLPGGVFRSALELPDVPDGARIPAFELERTPVTNGEFLEFVRSHPRWRRDRVPGMLAESRYLSHWAGPADLGSSALPEQPVTWVSWFAAEAYCRAENARLPKWNEWEYAAAADAVRIDARSDPAWRETILAWYSRPSTRPLPAVGADPANAYGLRDLHGLVWEWVEDYSALLVSADNREQGAADSLKYCGGAALSMSDRDNYAVLMRVAMLSSLEGAGATANLGFRCARSP